MMSGPDEVSLHREHHRAVQSALSTIVEDARLASEMKPSCYPVHEKHLVSFALSFYAQECEKSLLPDIQRIQDRLTQLISYEWMCDVTAPADIRLIITALHDVVCHATEISNRIQE
jgi:hypothetical protein